MVLRDHLKALAHWATAPAGTGPLSIKSSDAQRAAVWTQVGIPQYPSREYRQLISSYRKNPIVRRATKLCAEAVASVEPVVRVNGKEEDRIAAQIAGFLKQPNPKQDRFNFIRDLAGFDKLSGNGWVEGVFGMSYDYFEQYALRPERMQIVPGANGWPAKYVYDPATGRTMEWDGEGRGQVSRILHIKDFAADNDHFGSGALEAAEQDIAVYENARTLARALMENGAVQSGALMYDPQVAPGSAKPDLDEKQRTKLQELLDQRRINRKNAGKPMVLANAFRWENMSSTLVDLEAEEIRNQAARQIANAFGVPPMLLGIPGDNTYSNFSEASRAFYRSTVIADATRIFGALGRWYGSIAKIENITLEVDEEKMWALADEVAAAWARIDNAQGLSINERREAKGYDALTDEGADRVLVSAGLIPLDQVLNGGIPAGVDPNVDFGADGDKDGNIGEGKKALLLPRP